MSGRDGPNRPSNLNSWPNPPERSPRDRSSRFDDELIGLDRDDPEAQAFAAHLDRMQRSTRRSPWRATSTTSARFVDSVHRAQGERWFAAVAVVLLLLAVAAFAIWDALRFVVTTWF